MNAKINDRRYVILHGNLFRTILILTLPVAINNFIISLYNMIDALFISSKGMLSLSSVTFIDPILNVFYAISMGITVAATSIIARKIGEGNFILAKKNIVQTIIIVTAIGVLIAIIGYLFAEAILRALGATDNIVEIATLYFKIQMLIVPLKFISDIYLAIKRAEGSNTKAMLINIVSIGIKVILTYVFIFEYQFGVTSLAYSTLIAFIFINVIALYELFIKTSHFKINIRDIQIDYKLITSLILIGIPLIIEKTSLSFSNVIVGMFTVGYSETVLAAYGLTNKLNTLIFSTSTGFGIALVTIISQNLGNKQIKRAKNAVWLTMILSLMISLLLLVLFFIFQKSIVSMFTKDDVKFYQHTINAMNVYTASVIPWTIFQIIIGVFQGAGHNIYPLIISIFRLYLFRIPVIYLLGRYTLLQEYSIWYGMLFANIFTAILAVTLYFIVKWEKTPKLFKKF